MFSCEKSQTQSRTPLVDEKKRLVGLTSPLQQRPSIFMVMSFLPTIFQIRFETSEIGIHIP
jgi:hypothetical protein